MPIMERDTHIEATPRLRSMLMPGTVAGRGLARLRILSWPAAGRMQRSLRRSAIARASAAES